MSERQVDIESPSEVNDDLGLRQYRDERRTKVFEEGPRKKVQSHTDRAGGVTIHEIQGGRITDKLHLHLGEVQNLLNPCRGETGNQSQGRANSATNRPIRLPRGDVPKVLPQLAAITTCQIVQTIIVAGHVRTPEVDGLRLLTGPSRHAGHHQLAQDQAPGVNLHQSTHTSQDAIDTIRLLRQFAHNARDPDRHHTDVSRTPPPRKEPAKQSKLPARELSPYSARLQKTKELSLRKPNQKDPNTIPVVRRGGSPSASYKHNRDEDETESMAGYNQNYGVHNNVNRGNLRPWVDTRQNYGGSPPFHTPNSSYQGSPQSGSPYHGGRGGWNGHQQHFHNNRG